MPDVPGVPPAEELSALPHAGLARLLAEAYRVSAEAVLIGRLQARVERRVGKGWNRCVTRTRPAGA